MNFVTNNLIFLLTIKKKFFLIKKDIYIYKNKTKHYEKFKPN